MENSFKKNKTEKKNSIVNISLDKSNATLNKSTSKRDLIDSKNSLKQNTKKMLNKLDKIDDEESIDHDKIIAELEALSKEELINEIEYNSLLQDKTIFEEFKEDNDWIKYSNNSSKSITKAFGNKENEKNDWSKIFLEMSLNSKLFHTEEEFRKYEKKGNINEKFVYSVNLFKEKNQLNAFEICLFPKFIMLINIMFQFTYIYNNENDFTTSLMKKLILILNYVVININALENESYNSNYNIPINSQKVYLGTCSFWLLCVIFFFKKCRDFQLIRKIENSTIIYEIEKRQPSEDQKTEVEYVVSGCEKFIFNSILVIIIYLYIPLVRDSISSILFIMDQYEVDPNLSVFLKSALQRNIFQLSVFIVSCFMMLLTIFIPLNLLRILNNNFPLLDPYLQNDTIFHSLNCSSLCSGSILDLDKRMCWDNVINNLFIVNLNRPINLYDKEEKVNKLLRKYKEFCRKSEHPYMIFYNGYTYYWKFHLFWFFLKHYFFLIIVKLPYSKIFTDFKLDNKEYRSVISFSLSTGFCFYLFYENINYFKKKYYLLHETFLELILTFGITIITLLYLGKTCALLYISERERLNNIIYNCEYISSGIISINLILVFLFIIFSCPCFRSSVAKRSFQTEKRWNKLQTSEIKPFLMELLWKPFWYNIFISDSTILNKPLNINEKFKNNYCNGKNVPDNTNNIIALTPEKRIKQLKIRSKIPNDLDQEEALNENEEIDNSLKKIFKCDILMRKWLQHKLEGIDVFWDGEVIGKRTCYTFFGRLLINEFPFKVLLIYDETGEKVEIPESEFATLGRLNIQNSDILRQKNIRDQLRSLNNLSVKYDEFYNEKKKKEDEEREEKELNNTKKNDPRSKKKKKGEFNVVEDLNKLKDLSLQIFSLGMLGGENIIKNGKFRVETNVPNKLLVQGFNIYFDEIDKDNSKKIKETIKFDQSEISLPAKNFKYSILNSILKINDEKIKDNAILDINLKKKMNRFEMTFKRYLDEITLSSLFLDLIYDNMSVTIAEIFHYFLNFEKRRKMRFFPHFHIEGILFICELWKLCNSSSVQGYWYIYFIQIWKINKEIIEKINLEKYFNPDSKLSICYYAMSRKSFEVFIEKTGLISYFKKQLIDDLYKRINQIIKHENKSNLKNKNEEEINIDLLQENENNLNDDFDDLKMNESENKIDKIIIQNKFIKSVHKSSMFNYITPIWLYCTINDETEVNRIPLDILQDLKNKKSAYLKGKDKNPEIIFNDMGERQLLMSLYNDEEIFQLYDNKHLSAPVTNSKKNNYTIKEFNHEKKGLNNVNNYGSRTIEVYLPAIYKYRDPKFEEDLGNLYETKIDNRGRIFYVYRNNQTTSFNHPKINKRVKTKIELDYDQLYGELPTEWEVIDYYSTELKIKRLLYINHRLKITSWYDPRKKN